MAKRKNDISEMEAVTFGLNKVISEFGCNFAQHILFEQRGDIVRAAIFSWLSEQLTSAVQSKHGRNYQLAQPIEQANNCVRFGYGSLIYKLGEQHHVDIQAILEPQE